MSILTQLSPLFATAVYVCYIVCPLWSQTLLPILSSSPLLWLKYNTVIRSNVLDVMREGHCWLIQQCETQILCLHLPQSQYCQLNQTALACSGCSLSLLHFRYTVFAQTGVACIYRSGLNPCPCFCKVPHSPKSEQVCISFQRTFKAVTKGFEPYPWGDSSFTEWASLIHTTTATQVSTLLYTRRKVPVKVSTLTLPEFSCKMCLGSYGLISWLKTFQFLS